MNLAAEHGRIRLGQVLLTVTAAALMFVAFAFFRAPDNAVEVARPGTATPRVLVSEVGMQPFELSVGVVGRVRPWQEISLAAEVNGRIDEVLVDIGDHVDAGQTLVSIETDDYEVALREAEANELRAEARLNESVAALNRMESLRTRGAISEREYEAALATQKASEADLASAQAGLDRANRNLSNTKVTAPFTGTIVERHVDPGALVGGDRALLVLADLDTVAVEIGLTEREIFRARGAENAFITSTSRPGVITEGTVDGVANRADAATGTYLVRIRVANGADQSFLGGMVVDVSIPYAKLDAVATVPAEAVLMPERDPHVFVIRDGRSVRVDVDIIAREAGNFGVVARGVAAAMIAGDMSDTDSPLSVGDVVVVVGQTQLADGSAVEVSQQQ